ncbi:unnamed protein product [Prunus brigantina]
MKRHTWLIFSFSDFPSSASSQPELCFSCPACNFSSVSSCCFFVFAYFFALSTFTTSTTTNKNQTSIKDSSNPTASYSKIYLHTKQKYTLSCDQPISMAKSKSFVGSKKLNTSETHSLVVLLALYLFLMLIRNRQWNDQRNIVTRVQSHHLACTDGPIHPLYLPTWMLYHQSCSINSLTVSHLSVSLSLSLSRNQ